MQIVKEKEVISKDIDKHENISYLDRVLKARLRKSREKSFLQATPPSR